MTTGKAIALTRQTLVSKVMSLQGKLEVVKQEMARVNINILGISELKGPGMGVSTTVGKNPLEEIQLPSESTKESEMQYLDAMSKTTE